MEYDTMMACINRLNLSRRFTDVSSHEKICKSYVRLIFFLIQASIGLFLLTITSLHCYIRITRLNTRAYGRIRARIKDRYYRRSPFCSLRNVNRRQVDNLVRITFNNRNKRINISIADNSYFIIKSKGNIDEIDKQYFMFQHME